MNSILRNVLAIIAGVIIGGVVNYGLILLGLKLFPVEGLDMSDPDSLGKAAEAGKFTTMNYVFPIIAHAMGTLVGAIVAGLIAANNKPIVALVVGVFFLIGGIISIQRIPAPIWFIVVDLALAFIPMAWIGGLIGMGLASQKR